MAQSASPLHSNLSASEAGNSEEAGQSPVDGECYSSKAVPSHSKLKTRIIVLIVASLSLIMVPGFVLGIATRQISWGIVLSSAIATIGSFFAGLYYNHNR